MRLQTDRLVIEPLAERDVPAFAAYRRIPEVARYQSWDVDYTKQRGAALVAAQAGWEFPPPGEWQQFAVRDATTGELLGDVAIHARDDQPGTFELGVTIAPAHQGRGIAVEALAAVVDRLVRDGAHRIYAECDARNAAVQAVLARVGLRREAELVEADWFKGEWTTVQTWAVLGRERRAEPPSRAEN